MHVPRTLLGLLAIVVCAGLPAASAAAPAPGAPAHAASAHRSHHRCARHHRGHKPRACRTTHRHRAGAAPTALRLHPTSARPGARVGPHRISHRTAGGARRPGSTTTGGALTASGRPGGAPASPAPCADGGLIPAPDNLAAVQTATLCLVNQVRGLHGLGALRFDAKLQSAAARHNDDMVARDYFDHVGPGGDTPLSRIHDSGYLTDPANGYEVGENIAWGTGTDATPQAIVQAWVNSPEHLANILDANYLDSGLAVGARAPATVSGGDAGAIYTQDFGAISPAA